MSNFDRYMNQYDDFVLMGPWEKLDCLVRVFPDDKGNAWVICEQDLMRSYAEFRLIEYAPGGEYYLSVKFDTKVAGVQVRSHERTIMIHKALEYQGIEAVIEKFSREALTEFAMNYRNMFGAEIMSAVKRRKLEMVAGISGEQEASIRRM